MSSPKLEAKDEHYTYEDYASWDENERYEIIDGVAYALATPLFIHQDISRNLFRKFDSFLQGKPCDVYYSPVSVRLNYDKGDDSVVEPDLVVICDKSNIDKKGYNGVPDIIIEILSLSNPRHDLILKFNKYLDAGVKEYWIVDPETKTIKLCVLNRDGYLTNVYKENDTISSQVLKGLKIKLSDIFVD